MLEYKGSLRHGMQLEMECRIYCPCRIRPGRLRRHRQQQLPPQPRQPRVNDGSGRLMTVVLVLHMKARELRTPWLPMPESRKPCGVWVGGVWGACGVGGWVCVCVWGGGQQEGQTLVSIPTITSTPSANCSALSHAPGTGSGRGRGPAPR